MQVKEIVCGYQDTEGFREGSKKYQNFTFEGEGGEAKTGRNTDYVLHQPAVDDSLHSQPCLKLLLCKCFKRDN